MKTGTFINGLFPTPRRKIAAIIVCGTICGLGMYATYASMAWSYLSDESAVCMNCHVMAPYYATWSHGSHREHASCNDCHVPQDNALKKWVFKGTDGLRHAAAFTMRGEPQVIRAIDESAAVIMNNCIRCHTQLNAEFVNTGKIDYETAANGGGKACWDCHRDVPHGGTNSLSSTPSALVPYPSSIVPEWLKSARERR